MLGRGYVQLQGDVGEKKRRTLSFGRRGMNGGGKRDTGKKKFIQ